MNILLTDGMEVQSFQYSGQVVHMGHLCGVTLLLLLAPRGWHCLVSSLAVTLAHGERLTAPGLPPPLTVHTHNAAVQEKAAGNSRAGATVEQENSN